MHSVVHVNLHCRVASSHLHRPRANVERDVHFKKELDFLIYMRRLAAGVKPCSSLRTFEQVAPAYQHHQKFVKPGNTLITSNVYLKWYDIYPEELPIPFELVRDARSFLLAEMEAGNLPLKNELGFAIHHRCSNQYILYICTWRNDNEVWETLYHRDLTGDGQFRVLERSSTTPTFCVWVLGAVWHEQQAWTRYLYSERDDAAKYAYVQDQMTGLV